MKTYLVGCDLQDKSIASYNSLYRTLEYYDSFDRVLEAMWVIKTKESAESILAVLRQRLRAQDRLFVVELHGDQASQNLMCSLEALETSSPEWRQ